MKLLITLMISLLTMTNLAYAESKYMCDGVGGTDEWTIYVDLNLGKAGFFDNDSTAIIPFQEIKFYETKPTQQEYIFKGKDLDGTTLLIAFNVTKQSAYLILDADGENPDTLTAENGCEADDHVDLNE